MKYALDLPNFGAFGDARTVAEMAVLAEQAGWDGLFIWDHLIRNIHTPVVDPWIALTAAAMVTERIKLGAMVTPIARRRPWKLARETATLDQLSNGRLIFGAGLGGASGSEVEWDYFGEEANLKTRAKMLDEGLTILDGLWSGEPFDFMGQHYQAKTQGFLPATAQRPRIPVWIAGFWPNKPPFRRAARWDGVFPIITAEGDSQQHLADLIAYVRDHRTSDAPFDIVYPSPPIEKAKRAEHVAPYKALGVTWWVETIDPDQFGSTWDGEWNLEAMKAHIAAGV